MNGLRRSQLLVAAVLAGSGPIRIAWSSPTAGVLVSRGVGVRVG
jgi:hypothetical protein